MLWVASVVTLLSMPKSNDLPTQFWPRHATLHHAISHHTTLHPNTGCFYSNLSCCVIQMGITGDYTVKIQECKVKATGDLNMKSSGTHFYKFYMNLPKYMSNALGLAGGDRMYISRTDDDVCALSKKWHGDSDIPVTLSESVTRRYNGREYTIIRFVLPKELANSLKAYRGKEVELHLRGNSIIMFF